MRPARRSAGRALAWLAAAALLAALAAPAAAEDLVIDNLAFKSLDGDAFAIARLDFVNTNLTRDEIIRLLTPDLPADDDRALAQKFEVTGFRSRRSTSSALMDPKSTSPD